MSDADRLPASVWIGQDLDWSSPHESVELCVELPFWLMVGLTQCHPKIEGHRFKVDLVGDYLELHVGDIQDSRGSCRYFGPYTGSELNNVKAKIDAACMAAGRPPVPSLPRKCKTVLKIKTRLRADVLSAQAETDTPRWRQSMTYLTSWCAAHIPVVNRVIQSYRLATYDMHAFEVSPWDIPVWFVRNDRTAFRVDGHPYRSWDHRPMTQESPDHEAKFCELISGAVRFEGRGPCGDFDLIG